MTVQASFRYDIGAEGWVAKSGSWRGAGGAGGSALWDTPLDYVLDSKQPFGKVRSAQMGMALDDLGVRCDVHVTGHSASYDMCYISDRDRDRAARLPNGSRSLFCSSLEELRAMLMLFMED